MKILIDIDEIGSKTQLKLDEYLLLSLLYLKVDNIYTYFGVNPESVDLMMYNLEKLGYVKITEEGCVLKEQSIQLFEGSEKIISKLDKVKLVRPDAVELWIDEYRNLFPTGVKSGGRPVKGDRDNCINKMKQFIKTTKHSKELILEVTKEYVNSYKNTNYDFMTSADYFIEKNKVSLLKAYIEDYETVKETKSKSNNNQYEDFL